MGDREVAVDVRRGTPGWQSSHQEHKIRHSKEKTGDGGLRWNCDADSGVR